MTKRNIKIVALLLVVILVSHIGMSFYRQRVPSLSKISGEIPDLNLTNDDYICVKNIDSMTKNKIVLFKQYGVHLAGKVVALSGEDLEVSKGFRDELEYKLPKSDSEMNTKIKVPANNTAIELYGVIHITPNSEIRYEMKYKVNGSLELYKCFIGL